MGMFRGLVAEPPDFSVRSVLQLAPGDWRMRNGHTARIDRKIDLPYQKGKKTLYFPIWAGNCVECGEGRTWNINGTYAAVGKHPFDIVGPA